MELNPLLIVDEQPITLNQALQYLEMSGKLNTFIATILRQHTLEQEIHSSEAEVDPVLVEQAIQQFRTDSQLLEEQQFQQWLRQRGLNYQALQQQMIRRIKLNRLIPKVTEPKLQECFIDRKLFLDRVILSRIVVDSQELAEELKSQILEEGMSFEPLAREYSLTDDRLMNGMMGAISRGQLSDGLRAVIDQAKPGDIVGPLWVDRRWCLFRVEQFLPASLADEQLQQSLRDEIFEQWVTEKLRRQQVHLLVA